MNFNISCLQFEYIVLEIMTMRNTLIILCIFCSGMLSAQTCLPGSITITTQAELDNFPILYPNCTIAPANVTIQGLGITNLQGLSNLTSITGELRILETAIQDFTGLNNLVQVRRGVYIAANQNLQSFQGLNSLTTIGTINSLYHYNLLIEYQPGVIDFTGLENLNYINGELLLHGNSNLVNLNGLNNLQYARHVRLQSNNSLISVAGLYGLESLLSFTASSNFSLVSLDGLQNLTDVNIFQFSGNQNLATLQHVNIVAPTHLNFYDNDSLTSLDGLEDIVTVTEFFSISENDLLTDISALSNADLNGTVWIRSNPLLNVCNYFSVCDHLFNGTITDISNNGSGCFDNAVVSNACTNGVIVVNTDCTQLEIVTNGATDSFHAIDKITSNSTLNNLSTTYKAGQCVELISGFEYNTNGVIGTEFNAYLEACP